MKIHLSNNDPLPAHWPVPSKSLYILPITEHLGILMILAGAALLLAGIWLLRKSKAAGVAQLGGNAAGEHAT